MIKRRQPAASPLAAGVPSSKGRVGVGRTDTEGPDQSPTSDLVGDNCPISHEEDVRIMGWNVNGVPVDHRKEKKQAIKGSSRPLQPRHCLLGGTERGVATVVIGGTVGGKGTQVVESGLLCRLLVQAISKA